MLDKISKRSQAEFSMLLVAFIWGGTFVMTKNALLDIGPFMFLGIRFTLAFLALALLNPKAVKEINRTTIRDGSLIGLFLFIGYIFQTVGLKYTTSSNAGFITGLNVVLVPLLYAALKRKLPDKSTILTVILAAVGLYLMSLQGGAFILAYGDLLILICAFGFALQIVAVDRYSYRHNPLAITAVQILFVGIVCLLIGIVIEPLPVLTFNSVTAIIFTSIFATSLAFLLQNSMQKYSTPTRFAIVLAMEPVFAGITGYLWAGDRLSQQALLGAGLILIAMLLAILVQKDQ